MTARRKKSRPEALGRVLAPLLRRVEAAFPDAGHRVWEVWEEAVGAEIARRARPLAFRRGTLVLGVTSSAWMHQLAFLRAEIADRVNAALGERLVRSVRLRAAPQPDEPSSAGRAGTGGPAPPWLERPVPPETRERIRQEIRGIRDPELRAAVERARTRAEQYLRSREEAPEDARPAGNTAGPARAR